MRKAIQIRILLLLCCLVLPAAALTADTADVESTQPGEATEATEAAEPAESADATDATEPAQPAVPIELDIVRLLFQESSSANNYANDYRDWLEVDFTLTNNLELDARAVRGTVVFYDLFGEAWWRIQITVNTPIAAGETLLWHGVVDYNSFLDSHRQARHARVENIYVEIEDVQVVTTDGKRLDF